MIQAGLPDARVDVQSEDDVHFSALVVSSEFEGLRLLQRHQRVYRTLGDKMGGEIHALAIRALTPGELAAGD
jgi:acid stress-induced BolA-like protein IbaG/YrbA